MTDRHHGACLCGAVRFEVAGGFDEFYLCHCTRCRKGSGSAHVANLFSKTAELTWLSGAEKVRTYILPGTRFAKSFCETCGAAVPTEATGGDDLMVPAGSLDSQLHQRPDLHIHTGSRACWDRDLEDVPTHDSVPWQE